MSASLSTSAPAAAGRSRVVLVTGSGRGIGAAVAAELASSCAAVIGLDLPQTDQSATSDACRAEGARFVAVEGDVASEAGLAGVQAAIAALGRLDIVVHCAGVAPGAGLHGDTAGLPLAEWQRVIDVNLTGSFLLCRAAVPWLKLNGWGRLVTLSSQTARTVSASSGAHYAASKAGVLALTKVLALELAPHGVTVNCVAPGLTRTRMAENFDTGAYAKTVPLGRLGEPADVALTVAFLASDAAAYITGATLDVNGGKYMA